MNVEIIWMMGGMSLMISELCSETIAQKLRN